jgi:hypothetical protein
MEAAGWTLVGLIAAYVAVCGGKIAARHGRNPVLYGVLSVISPVNLVLLGYLAFSDIERRRS